MRHQILTLLALILLPSACATYGHDKNPDLPPPVMAPAIDPGSLEPEEVVIEAERRRPGRPIPQDEIILLNPGAVDVPNLMGKKTSVPVPDRWRLVEAIGVKERWWDPYNQNTLKGDRPILNNDEWFVVAALTSDTVIEPRTFPTPVSIQTTEEAGQLDVFGESESLVVAQTIIPSLSLIKGMTAFKPQDLEFRLTPALQVNYVDIEERRALRVEPSRDIERTDYFVGLQEAFVDYHIRNVSDRYDFDSVRVGIQPFNADFRGFLFQDSQLGIRFFGNRDNNRFQYNLGAFARMEKDTNSGLNAANKPVREDYVLVANIFRQDLPLPGLTSQATFVMNLNREAGDIEIDENGFPVRPALIGNLRGREYDVGYLGYSADGRAGRLNLSATVYHAFGENRDGDFTSEPTDISAWFAAVEPSLDYDWLRFRLSALYASGDSDPFDDKEEGFDAIFENPQFAGADTSYWIRQTLPYAGGGRVISVNGRNGILNSLRSSKEQGQSNFTNPGTVLLGAGVDADILPELRLTLNANHLWFDDTSVLSATRVQGPIAEDIGYDLSASAIYRPNFIQNVVFRLSGAALVPGQGFDELFGSEEELDAFYSVLFNAVLSY